MLRNIAGIMADEEPKTAISASGLYNSSDLSGGSNFSMSDVILKGLSEFTYMAWFYLNPQDDNSFTVVGYVEKSPISVPILLEDDNIRLSMRNENGGTTSCIHNQAPPLNQWVHFCSTGSVSNGRCRIYVNGVLVQSAVMTYANSTDATTSYIADANGFDDVSMSQLNIFNRELTEAEVAEHYVYDQDLMQSGVLGWDAMTPAQRSGLIYSSSFTKDISISGNEFNDKSGNGITISPQPSLTGEQIYFYTNASDLPSDTQIYPLSAMNTTGAGSVYTNDSSFNLTALKASGFSMSLFCSTTTNTSLGYLMNLRGDGTSAIPQEVALKVQAGNYITLECYNGSSFNTFQTTVKLHTNGLTHIGVSIGAGGSSLSLYINGSEVNSGTVTNLATDSASALAIGEGQQGNLYSPTDGLKAMPRVTNREITPAEMLYFAENPSVCYDSIDNTSGLKDAIIYAPTLGEYNGSSGQALIDPASGITTNESGNVTYDGTGVSVECTPSDTQIYPVNSATLNGTSQYFNGGDNNKVTTGDFSISIWAKTTSVSGSRRLVAKINPSMVDQGYSLYANSGGELRLLIGTDVNNSVRTTTTGLGLNDGEWHHYLVYSNRGNPAIMYVDGVLQNTSYSEQFGTVTSIDNTGDFLVGSRFDGTDRWDGSLLFEEFAYGDLTSHVAELYNGGTPPCPSTYSTDLTNAINEGHALGNWDGNTGSELVGHKGVFNITNIGSTPFDGTGVSVECTPSDPPFYEPFDNLDNWDVIDAEQPYTVNGSFEVTTITDRFVNEVTTIKTNADLSSVGESPFNSITDVVTTDFTGLGNSSAYRSFNFRVNLYLDAIPSGDYYASMYLDDREDPGTVRLGVTGNIANGVNFSEEFIIDEELITSTTMEIRRSSENKMEFYLGGALYYTSVEVSPVHSAVLDSIQISVYGTRDPSYTVAYDNVTVTTTGLPS